jgi:hypothetical protein
VRYVLAGDHKFEAASASQGCHEICVGLRFRAAKLVVKVDDKQSNAKFSAEILENPQERHGVCSTRYSHAHTFAGGEHRRIADGVQHAFF